MPADIRPILDLIGRHESDGAARSQGVSSGYDVVWGRIPAAHRPVALIGRQLTEMTLREVLAWQGDVVARGSASSAAGRYQFIRATLDGTRLLAGIGLDAVFDAETQDKLAERLLDGRGWQKLVARQMTAETFADALAREWASLPVHWSQKGHTRQVTRGQSFYAGDGLNRASASCDEVLEAIADALAGRPGGNTAAVPPSQHDRLAALEARVARLEQAHAAVVEALKA